MSDKKDDWNEDMERNEELMNMSIRTKIIIEEDGWVHIQHDPPREYLSSPSVYEEGFGDINVDVVIEDRRQLKPKLVNITH